MLVFLALTNMAQDRIQVKLNAYFFSTQNYKCLPLLNLFSGIKCQEIVLVLKIEDVIVRGHSDHRLGFVHLVP